LNTSFAAAGAILPCKMNPKLDIWLAVLLIAAIWLAAGLRALK
jgi:hypothetical protein